jgi:hypothetical protein
MKKLWVIVSVLVLLGLIVGAIAIGCGETKKTEEPTANLTAQALLKKFTGSNIYTSGTNSGNISGKITDMLTGNPLVGTTVSAGGKSATTNSSGNYTLSGATPGEITFSTNASGYENISIVCNSSTINIGLLAENRSPMGTISGKVTDSSGKPVAGARIEAASETYFDEPPTTFTFTDSNGNYIITNEAGSVIVSAISGTVEANNTVTVFGSQYKRINLGTTETVNIQFPANTGTISGAITNSSTLNVLGVIAALVAGKNVLPIGGAGADSIAAGQFNLTVPPTQGTDQFLLVGIGDKTAVYHHSYWDCDYASVSAGQTVSRNLTIQEPVEMVSPAANATGVSAMPTFTWKPGTGTAYDFYILRWWGAEDRTVITPNLSYTLSTSESLASGNYEWDIVGIKVKAIKAVSLSGFDISKVTIDCLSQHLGWPFTVQ